MLKCKRCFYKWEQKDPDRLPKTCPNRKCKSPYWQVELTPYWRGVRENNQRKKDEKGTN